MFADVTGDIRADLLSRIGSLLCCNTAEIYPARPQHWIW